MYSLQRRRERIRRRPRRFQQVEADFAGFEIDIRVADGCCEGDFGRGERVGWRDEDVEVPETGCWGNLSVCGRLDWRMGFVLTVVRGGK